MVSDKTELITMIYIFAESLPALVKFSVIADTGQNEISVHELILRTKRM